MALTLTLDLHGEHLVTPVRTMGAAEAVANIRESRRGVTLGGLRIQRSD